MAGFFKRNILDKAMILGAVICIVITAFTAFAEDCEEKPQEVLRLHILAKLGQQGRPDAEIRSA